MIRREALMRLVTTWTRAVQNVPIVSVVASVIVGVFFTGAARQAQASVSLSVWLHAGDVYCHATAPGPRYFHSGISRVSVDGEHYSRWRWLDERPGWLDERRRDGRILDRVLDDLAVEFARVVAARDDRDVDHLLSFGCELTAAEAAADAIGAASYFRGGERVFYPAAGKIAVEWTPPDFGGLWALASSSYVTWPRAVALVVGNGAYPSGARLQSPVKDAADVAAALKRAGFDVTEEYDADRVALNEALATFETASDGAEVALVFYSGHGLGRDGAEYLLPVDVDRLDPAGPGLDEAPLRVVALDDVVAATARASARVVILDAMFDDGRPVREPPRPERRVPGPPNAANLLVAYAGSHGNMVYDGGEEENSPYTAALLRHLEEPGSTALATFGAVAAEVFDRTGGRQAPAVYSTLTTPVTLQRPEPRARGGADPVTLQRPEPARAWFIK